MDINQLPGVDVLGQSLEGPDVSMLGSFSRGAVSMIPLGDQGYAGISSLFSDKPYLQERQELEKEKEMDIQENPGSRLLGQVTGLIAPAIATGGASVPRSLGQVALEGSAIGGGFGLGNAIDTKASGGSNLSALGDISLGAWTGALGGIGGKMLGESVASGAESFGKTDAVKRFLTEERSKALGLTPISIGRLANEQGKTPQTLINEIAERIQAEPNISPKFWNLTSNVNDKVQFGLESKNKAGQLLGMQKNAAGEYTHLGNIPGEFFPEGQRVIDDLRSTAANYKGINSKVPDNLRKYAARIEDFKRKGKLDFNTLSQFKSAVGEELSKDYEGAPQAYQILKTNLNQAVDRLPPQAGVSPAAYQQAKKTYALWSDVLPLMSRGAAREMATTSGGIYRVGGAIGAATGHPQALIPAIGHEIVKASVPEAIANFMSGNKMGSAIKSFGKVVPQVSSQIISSQSQPINKQQIVQDFIRQQTDPNYAKSKTP